MYKHFYVVKAQYLQVVIDTLDDLNAPTDEWLNLVGLNREHANDLDNLVLEEPIWKLFAISAQKLRNNSFGKLVAHKLESTTLIVAEQMPKTLENALAYFLNIYNEQSNTPSFWLKTDGNFIWLCRKGAPGIEHGKWQVEQFVLQFLITLLQYYFGQNWQPKFIKLQLNSTEQHLVAEFFQLATNTQRSTVELDATYTGIAIEKSLMLDTLKWPVNYQPSQSDNVISKKPSQVIMQLLAQSYFGKSVNAQIIAQHLDINIRQLQRILAKEQVSLQTLIDDYRKQLAHNLIIDTGLSINEISAQLDYQDSANFVRAFKRWFAMTPLQFRKRY
ncbi:helix-turn-helix domain-containing protein [Colwelliaceae bacterium BS250]